MKLCRPCGTKLQTVRVCPKCQYVPHPPTVGDANIGPFMLTLWGPDAEWGIGIKAMFFYKTPQLARDAVERFKAEPGDYVSWDIYDARPGSNDDNRDLNKGMF